MDTVFHGYRVPWMGRILIARLMVRSVGLREPQTIGGDDSDQEAQGKAHADEYQAGE